MTIDVVFDIGVTSAGKFQRIIDLLSDTSRPPVQISYSPYADTGSTLFNSQYDIPIVIPRGRVGDSVVRSVVVPISILCIDNTPKINADNKVCISMKGLKKISLSDLKLICKKLNVSTRSRSSMIEYLSTMPIDYTSDDIIRIIYKYAKPGSKVSNMEKMREILYMF